MPRQQAEIHHYDGTTFDIDGILLFGYYFQLIDDSNLRIGLMMGPYCSAPEAEAACQLAFDRNDY